MKEINEQIKALREENQLSQHELATILHVSRQTISKWELGKSTPDLDSIRKLATYFNVSTDYLLGTEKTLLERIMQFPMRRKVSEMSSREDSQALVSPWVKNPVAFLEEGKRVAAFLEIAGENYPSMSWHKLPGTPNLQVILTEDSFLFVNKKSSNGEEKFVPLCDIESIRFSFAKGNLTGRQQVYTLIDLVSKETTYRLFFYSIKVAHVLWHNQTVKDIPKKIEKEYVKAIQEKSSKGLDTFVRETPNVSYFYGR